MAIIANHLEITLRYTYQGQSCQNSQWYATGGAAFLTAGASQVGEAWWNDVKTAWRGLIQTGANFSFRSVLVQDDTLTGTYGEYAIPVAEQTGTRAPTANPEYLPSFCAAGVRLTVSDRVTRPGQKRLPGITEYDTNAGLVALAFVTLVNAVAVKYSSFITLGAPVALGILTPEVVRQNPVNRNVIASQNVIGYVVNPNVTSQVSRKLGRGR